MIRYGILIGISIFVASLLAVITQTYKRLDEWMFNVMEPFNFLEWMDFLGNKYVITIGAILLLLLLLKNGQKFGALTVLLTIGVGLLIRHLLTNGVGRERPPFYEGIEKFSFVSGHTMQGTIFYFLASYFLVNVGKIKKHKTSLYILAITISVLIGLGRIIEKAHYFTDVAGGFGLGMTIALLGILCYEKLSDHEK